VATREGMGSMSIQDVQERWIDRKEEFDEMERKALEEDPRAKEAPSLVSDTGDDDEDDEIEEMQRSFTSSGVKVVRRPPT